MERWSHWRKVTVGIPYAGIVALATWAGNLRVEFAQLRAEDALVEQRLTIIQLELTRVRTERAAVQPAAETIERLTYLEARVTGCEYRR